jgi:hypothetical protein
MRLLQCKAACSIHHTAIVSLLSLYHNHILRPGLQLVYHYRYFDPSLGHRTTMAHVRSIILSLALTSLLLTLTNGEHHMKWKVKQRQSGDANIPLIVSNQCRETIHPGILTQAGVAPEESG